MIDQDEHLLSGSFEVVASLFESEHYGQEFLIVDFVITLGRNHLEK